MFIVCYVAPLIAPEVFILALVVLQQTVTVTDRLAEFIY